MWNFVGINVQLNIMSIIFLFSIVIYEQINIICQIRFYQIIEQWKWTIFLVCTYYHQKSQHIKRFEGNIQNMLKNSTEYTDIETQNFTEE